MKFKKAIALFLICTILTTVTVTNVNADEMAYGRVYRWADQRIIDYLNRAYVQINASFLDAPYSNYYTSAVQIGIQIPQIAHISNQQTLEQPTVY